VAQKQVLTIAAADQNLALRLLSALILTWDLVPFATQGSLLREAALMHDGKSDSTGLQGQLLAFVEKHKQRLV
jgi:hypothetical protein